MQKIKVLVGWEETNYSAVAEVNGVVVVTKGTHIGSGEVWAGVPAKKIKDISPELTEGEINRIANAYVKYAQWYQESEE